MAHRNLVAVREVSSVVPERYVVALLGPNGAGKTSLLGAIAGLVPASSGQVLVGGTEITSLPAQQVARRGVRLVPENRALFPDMTVLENLQVGAGRLRRSQRRERVESAFELFPLLREWARQPAGVLSGGEQQMLSVARALATQPRVLQNARAVLPVADRAVLMARGGVILEGTALDVRRRIDSEGYLGRAGPSRSA